MMKIKKIQIGKIQIEYILQGKGIDLLFLHGGCGSFRTYEKFIYDLSKFYRIWAVSLPGAGKSSTLPRDWHFYDYSKVIYGFIRKNDIKPIIVGHSFGGAVSISAKAKYPEAFKNLVLLSAAGIKHKNPNRTIFKVMIYPFKILIPSIFDLQKRLLLKDVLVNLWCHPFDMLKIAGMFKRLDLKDTMKSINEKVLLLWGRGDENVPISYIKVFKMYLKNTKVYMFRGDHGFLYTQADKIASVLRKECK